MRKTEAANDRTRPRHPNQNRDRYAPAHHASRGTRSASSKENVASERACHPALLYCLPPTDKRPPRLTDRNRKVAALTGTDPPRGGPRDFAPRNPLNPQRSALPAYLYALSPQLQRAAGSLPLHHPAKFFLQLLRTNLNQGRPPMRTRIRHRTSPQVLNQLLNLLVRQ